MSQRNKVFCDVTIPILNNNMPSVLPTQNNKSQQVGPQAQQPMQQQVQQPVQQAIDYQALITQAQMSMQQLAQAQQQANITIPQVDNSRPSTLPEDNIKKEKINAKANGQYLPAANVSVLIVWWKFVLLE